MKLFIVIVNYQKYKETENCLASLFKFLPKEYLENIILVDNEGDREVEGIRKRFPKILIIKNKENLGFARAINQGIRKTLQSRASHILVLNNDTVIDSDFLTPLLASKYDLVSPIIRFKRGGGWLYDVGGRINWLIGRPHHINIKNKIENIKNTYKKLKIGYVSGCCLLIRREVVDKIGLFDEKFFLYFEDVDFCLRAKKAGFSLGVAKNSLVTHLLEEEKNPTRLFKLNNLLKSQLIFINKWVPWYFKLFAYLYYLWLKIKIVCIDSETSLSLNQVQDQGSE